LSREFLELALRAMVYRLLGDEGLPVATIGTGYGFKPELF
jgi:hypothetical protein